MSTPKTIALSVLVALTVASNACSMIAIAARKGKVTRMYYFLFNLSVADILTAFLTLLPELVWTEAEPVLRDGGDFACRVLKFVQMVAPYLSSYTLVMTALDRFQSICYPMVHRVWKPRDSHRKIAAAWAMALALCVPQAFVFGAEATPSGQVVCVAHLGSIEGWGTRLYVTWFSVSSFFIPLTAVAYCYIRICGEIRGNLHSKRHGSETLRPPSAPSTASTAAASAHPPLWVRRSFRPASLLSLHHGHEAEMEAFRPRTHSVEGITRAKIKSVKQTIVIILGYVACSTPAVGVQLWAVWYEHIEGLTYSTEWFFWLVTLNSILNPWIYIALNRDLQVSLANALCFWRAAAPLGSSGRSSANCDVASPKAKGPLATGSVSHAAGAFEPGFVPRPRSVSLSRTPASRRSPTAAEDAHRPRANTAAGRPQRAASAMTSKAPN